MSQTETSIFIISFSIAFILLYKFIKFKIKAKDLVETKATCTDTTLRTTYQKNIRFYYYTYIWKNEEYKTSDKSLFKIPGFEIKKTFKILIDPKNPNKCLTPLEIFYSKIYLISGIILIILPFLL